MNKEQEIRKYTTKELLWYLENHQREFDTEGLVQICDELLLRNESIKFLKVRYENLLKQLSNTVLKRFEENEAWYSPATMRVVDSELNKRRIDRIQWFYSKDGIESIGPINRTQLLDRLANGELSDNYLVWKQGTSDWVKIKTLEYFKRREFFDQIFDEEPIQPQKYSSVNGESKTLESTSMSGGNSVAAGVLELVSIPFWIGTIAFSVISSFNTEIGFMIPLLFSVFATCATIPIAIGLFMKKKWAWSMKVFIALGAISLIVLKAVFQDANFLWMFFGAYQGLILLLIWNGREVYNN